MAQPKTTIELNGKLYDASTGAILKDSVRRKAVAVDGFFRRPGSANNTTPAKPKAKPTRPARTAVKAPGRTLERSRTLMRHVVRKPQPVVQASSPAKAKSSDVSKPTGLLRSRQERARAVPKSTLISRFSANSTVSKKLAPLAVRPHPDAANSDALQKIAPPISKASPAKPSASSFEKALESASSHRQAPLKAKNKLHHRVAKKLGIKATTVSVASVTLVILLLAGFTAYQNVPNISMHLAGARAGFDASLPGYTPGGFGLAGPIKTSPGAITISFRSHSDSRSYDITQKPSNWTSDSLRSNFFATTDSPTAYQDKGKTIYLYNNGSSAAWVNGGILYQITGNAQLSSDQVVNIADSL